MKKKQNRNIVNFVSFINQITQDSEFAPIGCITIEEELKEKYEMTTSEFNDYVIRLQRMWKKFSK